jgi:ribosome-associated protein
MTKTRKAVTTNVGAKTSHKGSKKKTKDINELMKDQIVGGMQEKKAKEIICIDLRNIKNAIADFFVICHADSKTHVEAIADSVEEYVHDQTGENPYHKEGTANAEWILLDYVNVVAHIFQKELRDFYGIEKLWADAEIQRIAGNY